MVAPMLKSIPTFCAPDESHPSPTKPAPQPSDAHTEATRPDKLGPCRRPLDPSGDRASEGSGCSGDPALCGVGRLLWSAARTRG